MKASKSTRQGSSAWRRSVMGVIGALTLSAVMLFCVACTGDDLPDKDTTGSTTGTTTGTTAGTTAGTTSGTVTDPAPGTGTTTSGETSAKPLDPDAGTVDPNAGTGDPPAGTTDGTTKFGSRFMH